MIGRVATNSGIRVGVAVACALAACGDAGDSADRFTSEVAPAERYGGTAVVLSNAPIETFNPVSTSDDLSQSVQRDLVFMTMLRSSAELQPLPWLAESWTINADTTRVEFRLRGDIVWEDGEPTTAYDVEFTFELLKNPETAFQNAQWMAGWEGAEVVDDRTVRFAVQPRAGLFSGWERLPIMPRHILEDIPAAEVGRHAFGQVPIGNGPFRLVEQRTGDTWIFAANEAFPDDLGGRPYLDRLIIRQVPEAATQLAELRGGEAQLILRADANQVEQARRDPALAVRDYPSRAYGLIAWNEQREMFRDARVRRAFTMALDRRQIVDAVLNGLGEVANGPVGSWHPGYDPALAPLPFDTAGARALLTEAGWVDSDGDGVRDRDGEALAFTISTSERQSYQDIAVIAQSRLEAVGADVEVRSVEGNSFIGDITSPERRFDAFVLEWSSDVEIDDRNLFSCDAVGEALQFTSYCNESLEPTLDSIPSAASRDEQIRLLRRYARVMHEDQPFTFLYFVRDAVIQRRELQGVTLDIRGDLTAAREWWIHPDARDARTDAGAQD